MVSEKLISLGIYANSSNNNKKNEKNISKVSSEATKNFAGEEIIHLSTRFITDDVPPRNYEGLKSESTIFLPNVTTLPSKRPAPVVEKTDLNDEVMLKPPNNSNIFENDVSKNVHEDTFKNALTNTKELSRIDINAFERGKLPLIQNTENQSQINPVNISSILDENSTLEDKNKSTFHIGLPTNLPIINKNKYVSTQYVDGVDNFGSNLILRKEKSHVNDGYMIKTPTENGTTFSTKTVKVNEKDNSSVFFPQNDFIQSYKDRHFEPGKPSKPVLLNYSNCKKNTFSGNHKETCKPSDLQSEAKMSKLNELLMSEDIIQPSKEKPSKITSEQVKTMRKELIASDVEIPDDEIKLKKTDEQRPRFAIKPQLEIPQNAFVNDVNFRNHLENIIANSKSLKENSLQNKTENDLVGSQTQKYKFLVEGIDFPNRMSAEIESEKIEKDNILSSKELKGFSYIKDKEVAKQVTMKAAQVTARRPHEFVENVAIEREIISMSKNEIYENERLKEARGNLHAHIKDMKKNNFPQKSLISKKEKSNASSYIDFNKPIKIDRLNGKKSLEIDAVFSKKLVEMKAKSEEHNIPHDTSRIFLRPHDKDTEQLRKLEEERIKSLRKRNYSMGTLGPKETLVSKKLHYKESKQSLEQEMQLSSTEDTDSNRAKNVEQTKEESRQIEKSIFDSSSRSAAPNLNENSGSVSSKQFVFTGKYQPAELADKNSVKKMHPFSDSSPGQLFDVDYDNSDENSYASELSGRESTLSHKKHKKFKHKKKSDLKLQSKHKKGLVENSEKKAQVRTNRDSQQNQGNKSVGSLFVKEFHSDPELLEGRKQVYSRYSRIVNNNKTSLISRLPNVRQSNSVIEGFISVPKFSVERKDHKITGDAKFQNKINQGRMTRSKTLPYKIAVVSGSEKMFKLFNGQVNMGYGWIDSSTNFKGWSSSLARSLPTLESAIVDPELKRIDRQGGQYRVQMKLNAFTKGKVPFSENIVIDNYDKSNYLVHDDVNESKKQDEISNYFGNYYFTKSQIPIYGNQGKSTLSFQVTSDENVLKSQINNYRECNDSYAIKSITPTLPVKAPSTIEFDLELLKADKTNTENYSVNYLKLENLFDSSVKHQIDLKKNNSIFPKRTSMQLAKDEFQSQNNIPNIVRGSILIRNTMDKNTGRRHQESFDEVDGKQDSNLFHKEYFQNRENPMYASDFEAKENLKNPKMITKSDIFPDVVFELNKSQTFDRNVPIEKEWYYDHIWNSEVIPKLQHSKKNGAWKLKSVETLGNRDWKTFRNHSTTSSHHVRQSIDVQREEEELIGPLGGDEVHNVEENLNVDAISEKVELSLLDGAVTIEVRVRCERVVPIRGSKDMFRKSAVVVSRKIEIDMTVSPDRRAIYDAAVSLSRKRKSTNLNEECLRLDAKETFELYCKLMEIADEAGDTKEGLLFGSILIDKELEEETRVSYGASSPEVLITKNDLMKPVNSTKYGTQRSRLA